MSATTAGSRSFILWLYSWVILVNKKIN